MAQRSYNSLHLILLQITLRCVVPSMSKRKHPERAFELISLGRASSASHSGISKLLAHISEHGLPETFDSSAQCRARKEICRKTPNQYGPLVVDLEIPLEKGGHTTMSFQNPVAFFHYACAKSAHYSRIVSTALDNHPCTPASPWNLVIYQDGMDPSDGLSKNHSRKSAVFYWSVREFGMAALAYEQVWGTLCVARNTEYHQLAGGVSQLFHKVLELFFHDQQQRRFY